MKEDITNYLLAKLKANPEWKFQINQKEWQTDFLRFYKSQTNYNISKTSTSLDVSVYKNKKSYGFSIDQPDSEKIDSAIQNILTVIDSLPEDPDFVDVETDLSMKPETRKTNNIEAVSLDKKIGILQQIAAEAAKLGFEIYGTFVCNYQHTRIINSNGIDKQQWNSPVYFEVKAVKTDNQVTVLQTYGGELFDTFNLSDFTSQLARKMNYAQYPVVDVDPGEYDVILAPRCIAEYMLYLSGSMTARSYDQKTSYFQDRLGQKLFPEYISITDNPDDTDLISFDYNGDGHIYKPLPLVENGVFKNFMCDNYYAHKTGLPKNGNSGECMVLQPGNDSLDSMIKSVKKGLYISSLHYMNFINQKETSVTGLTRDGTFLIENGEIIRVVNSLRFTEIIARIFQNITILENKCQTIPFSENYEMFGISSAKAPHVLVKSFNISSSTKTI
jgi:predicted Zn-dependent protease